MKLLDYQESTRETAIYPGATEGTSLGIAYCMLGLVSETNEARLAWRLRVVENYADRTADELKDVLWYIARLSDELDLTLSDIVHVWTGVQLETFEEFTHVRATRHPRSHAQVPTDILLNRLAEHIAILSGTVKKVIRDDGGVLDQAKRLIVATQLGSIFNYWCVLLERLEKDISVAAQENLDKLNDRKERGVIGGSGDSR